MISSYEEAFGGMGHWATAAYAPGASCSAAAVRQISGNWSNLPVDLERHAEMFARAHLAEDVRARPPRGPRSDDVSRQVLGGHSWAQRAPQRRDRISAASPAGLQQPVQPLAFQGAASREGLPLSEVHHPAASELSNPLGFTLYSPSTAKGKATVHSQGIVPVQEGLQGPRGRINRFPAGGYPMDPVWHRMSRTEESPQPWTVYAELEGQPRGRGSSYPKDLDPYPDCAK
eukprot:CAMPEP_0115149018 /NCGR_PEP_ID=MMETSP0227-20121206/64210_1 /TAXON_ID=89957 /ORGANISM="Polarella glacialis, Strain CCMP 1383" /LENGTH=229 /DNA_ID=CAMNT_0002559145 /DNA_START=28 /DNA_END=718 /DNA_ORIENTATION=+